MFHFLSLLIACSPSGSVVVEKKAVVDDTGVTDDTGATVDPIDTATPEDTENPTDTSDTVDTDPVDTGSVDTEEPVLPADNNNPNVYPNYWEGERTLTYGNCSESVVEYGLERTNDFPNWMAECDCDEIYEIQLNTSFACGFPLDYSVFYRGIRYDGTEISVRYWPNNPQSPVPASELAIGTLISTGSGEEVWGYQYDAVGAGGEMVTVTGEVSFLE